MKRALAFLFFFGLAFISTGCVSLNDPEASQEFRADVVGKVRAGQVIGQTFVSRRPGLNGILLWLHPEPDAVSQDSRLVANLYHGPGDRDPLFSFSVPAASLSGSNQLNIPIPPQDGPASQSYYLTLSASTGSIQVFGRAEDAYPGGQLFINSQPEEADLGFRLTYDYSWQAMLSDLGEVLAQLWLILPLALTLWLPGWLLLGWLGFRQRFDWGERLAISVGLSLAIIPILMTWTSALGLPWSRTTVWLASGFLVSVALWESRDKVGRVLRAAQLEGLKARARGCPETLVIALALAGVFLLSLAVRLAMARDLSAPPWVDSVHHAMIASMIAEQGSFPKSYAPFLDIETANYHAGFHSLVAVFHWLSGLEIPSAMLLLGQVLNALTIFAVYLLTTTFVRDRLAGVAAALITGFFTPMPAYYTSWGRYTELDGLLILPVAAALIISFLDPEKTSGERIPFPALPHFNVRLLALASLTCAGLFLTHYRVMAFLGCLILAFLFAWAIESMLEGNFWAKILNGLPPLVLATIISILLSLPWWPSTLSTLLIPKLAWGQGTAALFSDFTWQYLTTALGRQAIILAGLGLALGLILRRGFVFILGFWVSLLFVLANLGALGLPGNGFVNNTSVEITLFMPISVLGGYFISRAVAAGRALIPGHWARGYSAILGTVGLAAAMLGARTLLPILNPVTMLFREADRPAMAWIHEHIPADETILINPFAWGYGLYAGNDGGYWIVPMAGRKTMPPPVLYGLGNDPAKSRRISEICREVLDKGAQPDALYTYLESQNVHYIYVGSRGGVISPRLLQDSPHFRVLYTWEGTWVFRLQ